MQTQQSYKKPTLVIRVEDADSAVIMAVARKLDMSPEDKAAFLHAATQDGVNYDDIIRLSKKYINLKVRK